jgi:hypothetical protein
MCAGQVTGLRRCVRAPKRAAAMSKLRTSMMLQRFLRPVVSEQTDATDSVKETVSELRPGTLLSVMTMLNKSQSTPRA